jgi:hypothetical protein
MCHSIGSEAGLSELARTDEVELAMPYAFVRVDLAPPAA